MCKPILIDLDKLSHSTFTASMFSHLQLVQLINSLQW